MQKLRDFRKPVGFWKVAKLRSPVLLVTATYTWRWACSNGVMVLTGENSSAGRENCPPVLLRPPQISHGLTWNRTHSSAVRDRQRTDWYMSRLLEAKYESTLDKRFQFVPRREHILLVVQRRGSRRITRLRTPFIWDVTSCHWVCCSLWRVHECAVGKGQGSSVKPGGTWNKVKCQLDPTM